MRTLCENSRGLSSGPWEPQDFHHFLLLKKRERRKKKKKLAALRNLRLHCVALWALLPLPDPQAFIYTGPLPVFMCSLDKGSVRGSRTSERTPLHSLPSSNIILNEAAGGFPEVAGLEQNVLAEDRSTVPRLRPGSLGGWGGESQSRREEVWGTADRMGPPPKILILITVSKSGRPCISHLLSGKRQFVQHTRAFTTFTGNRDLQVLHNNDLQSWNVFCLEVGRRRLLVDLLAHSLKDQNVPFSAKWCAEIGAIRAVTSQNARMLYWHEREWCQEMRFALPKH